MRPERLCPVCGKSEYTPFSAENIDDRKITAASYSSRKEPEFMHLRLVRCSNCGLLYTPSVPDTSFLDSAYTNASYDSDEEARFAASTYAEALKPYVSQIENKKDAIDVGAGNGALLPLLKEYGFARAIGIEPSQTAIEAAPDAARRFLRKGLFTEEIVADLFPSLMCSFMTLEHMPDPGEFAKTAYRILNKGGMCAIVVHNYKALLNRFLGARSPIMDIEHLQLFCPKAAEMLMREAGFDIVAIQSLKNAYPIRYWLRLTPMPAKIKKPIASLFEAMRISRVPLSFNVGNLLAVGRKS
ncbi:MAG: class I SAM-dependent methyltransferase [Synergistaceae bacterium]|jgi:SAM-dependent methyltransferase|nr:class I SAM-dependent methyltransferase [Synergistaceae bacterium]